VPFFDAENQGQNSRQNRLRHGYPVDRELLGRLWPPEPPVKQGQIMFFDAERRLQLIVQRKPSAYLAVNEQGAHQDWL
jgi:hypothetical protein